MLPVGLGIFDLRVVATACLLCACAGHAESSPRAETYLTPQKPLAESGQMDAFAPLPEQAPVLDAKARLGQRLFWDKRLSGDGLVACSTCHDFSLGGANGQARSSLPNRGAVPVNVPSVFNLAYDFRFSWNGKFVDIGQQLDAALALREAMGSTWDASFRKLREDHSYTRDFAAAYDAGLSPATIRDALARYSLSLTTPRSRFDSYLRGRAQLSESEQRGFAMFREYGCVSCHQGVNVGGNMYQRFGVMRDYFLDRGQPTRADLGLFAFTGKEEDRHVFRVPSLRNVARTAPYFHDGSVVALTEAVQVMARYQLGRELSTPQAHDIAAFLETLNGEVPWGAP